jgi:hypothetical protein
MFDVFLEQPNLLYPYCLLLNVWWISVLNSMVHFVVPMAPSFLLD